MKINELIQDFEIWTTNEEKELLNKLKDPVKLASLNEHDQFRVQALIRKSLVSKIGMEDPSIVANEKFK
ncbi:hypothetical protein UFOVP181_94 [uncultured Caudovirales phage]|uniref:Uncharacterized protein n=1 Tax=uncultured Caudovirales phage TaxID=2100421 RepID=A0A6J7WE72_9CAUD|nr:hypothetical protein UFOVP57_68 [uncultured Caudovirales phage]CAB5208632.1 hypothetical protein UFOVP181_94 [uncultured Caudovirales phage]